MAIAIQSYDSETRAYWCLLTVQMVSAITLLFLNSLVLAGHLNSPGFSTANTVILGTFALMSIGTFLCEFGKLKDAERALYLTAFLVFAVLAGLSSLGISHIFNARTVAWISMPLSVLAGIGVLGFIVSSCSRG